jgi:dephospho-CoA kinase
MNAGAKQKPIIIGLTGSIGMGKSAVADMFEGAGIPVFDADAQVHLLQAKGGALVGAIENAFPGTTGENGVDRQKLGQAVLGDREKLSQLESIIHPAIGALRSAFMRDYADAPMLVFDIPLLFETGGWQNMDKIIVVSAPADVQRARVLARPGMTKERFEQILKLQMPDSEKRARADFIIDTNEPMENTKAAVDKIIKNLSAPLV